MKKPIVTKSIRVLIVVILVIAALFRGRTASYLYFGVIGVFLVITMLPSLVDWVFHQFTKLHHKITSLQLMSKRQILQEEKEKSDLTCTTIEINNEKRMEEEKKKEMEQKRKLLMMRQICMRLTEKLKSAYPDATWEWSEQEPELYDILNGSRVRIRCYDAENYTHADLTIDPYARLHFEMLVVGGFQSENSNGEEKREKPSDSVSVFDTEAWFELNGRPALEQLITELNAQGYTKLTIKESGEVVVRREKKEFLQTTLNNFPNKKYWNELVNLFCNYQLTANIKNNTITVSWY